MESQIGRNEKNFVLALLTQHVQLPSSEVACHSYLHLELYRSYKHWPSHVRDLNSCPIKLDPWASYSKLTEYLLSTVPKAWLRYCEPGFIIDSENGRSIVAGTWKTTALQLYLSYSLPTLSVTQTMLILDSVDPTCSLVMILFVLAATEVFTRPVQCLQLLYNSRYK